MTRGGVPRAIPGFPQEEKVAGVVRWESPRGAFDPNFMEPPSVSSKPWPKLWSSHP